MKQDDKSDIDIVPYVKALDGLKLIFEEKIPLEAYTRIKFTITKDRMKVVDLDKLLELLCSNYLKYSFILCIQSNERLDIIYHAFTVCLHMIGDDD